MRPFCRRELWRPNRARTGTDRPVFLSKNSIACDTSFAKGAKSRILSGNCRGWRRCAQSRAQGSVRRLYGQKERRILPQTAGNGEVMVYLSLIEDTGIRG